MTRWTTLPLAALAALLVGAAPAPSATDAPDLQAITLAEPQPDWYSDELHERVLDAAASGAGVALPDGAQVPTSALAFTGIRPGSWMIAPGGCTLNFVFGDAPGSGAEATSTRLSGHGQGQAGPDQDRPGNGGGNGNGNGGGNGGGSGGGSGTFIGTAGHCTDVGDEVTVVAAPGVLMNIGTTVTSVDNGIGDDFALIEIREEMVEHVNPSTAFFGGPTATGDPQVGSLVAHAGHGLVIGAGGTPRAGVTVYRGDGEERGSDAVAYNGAASPGDSGSFLVDLDGMTAAGNVTHLVVGGPYVPGNVAGTSIDRMLEIAGQPLVTAPAGPDPTS
jgi:hypothetical protein